MRRPWIGGMDFHNFHWTKITSSKRGDEKLKKKKNWGVILCYFCWERKENDDEF
jgi:hypothetical protein